MVQRNMEIKPSDLEVEPIGERSGQCDCCGKQSRTVWGFVHRHDAETVASYFMQWTVGKSIADHPANFDLIYGSWGEGTSAKDRCAISLIHFVNEAGPSVMVTDAKDRPLASSDLVGSVTTRNDVVGTALAKAAFAIFDAVIVQDKRLQ